MKLPIQAHPIMRSMSSVRISDALINGVTSSGCDVTSCGWAIAACVATAPFGAPAVAACLIGLGALDCRDCIWETIQAGFLQPGRDHPL